MAWWGDRFMAAMRELRDAQREIEGTIARTTARRDEAIETICGLIEAWDAETERIYPEARSEAREGGSDA